MANSKYKNAPSREYSFIPSEGWDDSTLDKKRAELLAPLATIRPGVEPLILLTQFTWTVVVVNGCLTTYKHWLGEGANLNLFAMCLLIAMVGVVGLLGFLTDLGKRKSAIALIGYRLSCSVIALFFTIGFYWG